MFQLVFNNSYSSLEANISLSSLNSSKGFVPSLTVTGSLLSVLCDNSSKLHVELVGEQPPGTTCSWLPV